MSDLDRPFATRRRARAALAVVLMLAGTLAFVAPSSADAPGPVNPAAAAQGFLVVTEGDTRLAANESEGPIAVGGDLSFDQYQVAIHTAGTFRVAPGDAEPTSLLVGGAVDLAASAGQVIVEKGWVGIADPTGAEAKRQNPNQITVNAPGAAWDANPKVFGQNSAQPLDSAFRSSGLDIAGAFAGWRSLAAGLATCPANITLTGANGPDQPWQPGSEGYVQTGPTEGPRYLVLDEAQLAQLPAITFRPGYEPTAARPLVVNVVSADGVITDWNPTNINGDTNGFAPYILWNMGALSQLTITGSNQLAGTVLIPNGALVQNGNGNLVGGIYAASFVHGGSGEIHDFQFATTLAGCGQGPTTTTTSTTVPSTTSTSTSTSTTSTSTTSTSTTSTSTTSTTVPSTTTSTTSTSTTVPSTTSTSTTVPSTTSSSTTSTSVPPTTSTSTTSTTVPSTTTSSSVAPTSTIPPSTSSTTALVSPTTQDRADVLGATQDLGGRPGGGVAGATTTRGALPYTGADSGWSITLGLALFGSGAALLALAARGRRQG